jgi:hypothetical protein
MSDPLQFLREHTAESFLRAYERCMNPPSQDLGTPALICAAFSAELGLKEILRNHGIPFKKFKREHKYLNLLALLPQGETDSLRAEMISEWPDFNLQLTAASNAFVTWRYFFDSLDPIEVNGKFVAAFARTVLQRVRRLKP